jgi:hypothetical protein
MFILKGLSRSLPGGRRGNPLIYYVSLDGLQMEIRTVDRARVLTLTSRCSVLTQCLPHSMRVLWLFCVVMFLCRLSKLGISTLNCNGESNFLITG